MTRSRALRSLASALVASAVAGSAASAGAPEPLAFDTSFSTDGWTTFDVGDAGWADGYGAQDAALSDGDVVLVGGDESTDATVVRIQDDGTPDPGFGAGDGVVELDLGANDHATSVAIDAEDRIVIAGYAVGAGVLVARLLADGTPDPGFGGGDGIVTWRRGNPATDIAVTSTGRIVVLTGDDARVTIVRLKTDGSFDGSFGGGDGRVSSTLGGQAPALDAVTIDDRGRIAAAGAVFTAGGARDIAVVRLRRDGTFDPNFSGDGRTLVDFGGRGDSGRGIAVQPNGRIVIVGETYSDADDDSDPVFVRLRADGSPDPSFGANGRRRLTLGPGIEVFAAGAIEPDGDLVATGYADGNLLVASATPDGVKVTYRIKDIAGRNDWGTAIMLAPDDRLWVAGVFTVSSTRRYGLARLFPA